MRYALIKNGVVINIAIWDGVKEWAPDCDEKVDVTEVTCDIGYLYVNGEFIKNE